MPKIEVLAKPFYRYLGQDIPIEKLVEVFPAAKAELDEHDKAGQLFKIELNDTNRPDLWSTAGLARQFKLFLTEEIPAYPFFSTEDQTADYGGREIHVDPDLETIRPFITGFVVRGRKIDDPLLIEIIQTQEKLCWNFGQKRRAIAMGVYRNDMISYPVRYRAADPDSTSFVPLDYKRELTLREIVREHPKGKEFGHVVSEYEKFPFITDNNGDVLSFPPVINSAKIGAVEVGDTDLFIELTGTDIHSLTLAGSIVACDLSDAGFEILPVKVVYPYDTPLGREVVNPNYFQPRMRLEISYAHKLLGEKFTSEEAAGYLQKMGCRAEYEHDAVIIRPPEYRNDFLHPVDVVEDIMIGRGMDSFSPVMPADFTVGRLTSMTEFSRRVKDIMVGLGFQEMVYNYLGSKREYIDLMEPHLEEAGQSGDRSAYSEEQLRDITVRISNPMTENYEYVRSSIIPCLLSSESVSAHAVYPHRLFEAGKIARLDASENYGTKTCDYLGFLNADRNTDFNGVNSQVSALFFYSAKEYTLEESDDPRFIRGRCARIIYNNKTAGVFGEVHPGVLENWGIQMVCTACEIDLSVIIE